MTESPVVRLRNVAKTYQAGTITVAAVRGVSLDIPPQRFSMLVGPSGSGKTTLLNLIGCIDRPSGGTVEIGGQPVAALGDDALSDFRARHIGFVFQNFNLIAVLSAYENVEFPLLQLGMAASARAAATERMLRDVGLHEQRHQRPNQLSGGQQQRVAIARALVKQPTLVLADEPTANLDSQTGAAIVDLMREMQARSRTTFVFSTHDPELMSQADELFRIRDGALEQHVSGRAA